MDPRERGHASVRRGERRVGGSSSSAPGHVGESSSSAPRYIGESSASAAHSPPPPPPPSEAHAAAPGAGDGFPGGPEDRTVLSTYRDHEAGFVWRGEGRPTLRAVSHGKKIVDFPPPSDRIRECVHRVGLGNLLVSRYTVIDRGLISALVERWHKETCSFHLPVGEMTITLDDIASLTGLPIDGRFFSPSRLVRDTAIPILEEELQMSYEEARAEVDLARGPCITFGKLRSICEDAVQQEALAEARGEEVAANGHFRVSEKAYILYLVGCLLLPDKSGDAVPASYFALVHSEHLARSFSWGGLMLAHLYSQLSDASAHKVRQIAGNLGVVQAWVYWHLPRLASFVLSDVWTPQLPLMCRMEPVRGSGQLETFRSVLDTLTPSQVVWCPYRDYRQHHPRTPRALFRGFVRFGSAMSRVDPDRVLRQFGYRQGIPPSPISAVTVELCDELWDEWELHTLDDNILIPVPDDDPGASSADYMSWYIRVSHPWMLESSYHDQAHRFLPIVLPTVDFGSSTHDWQQVYTLAEQLVRCSVRDTPSFDIGRRIMAYGHHHGQYQEEEQEEERRRRRPRH